jgi:ABC-2 type transport system permease protein
VIGDIWTVMWKEWKEILLQGGSLRGGRLGPLILIGVFGIFLPLQMGRAWVESPLVLMYWAWVPFLLISGVIVDAFAGERERHTLETLLASRLSDRAILFGKIAAAVGYAWGLALASLILGLVTVNIAHGRGELLLYPLGTALGVIGFSLLVAVLAASLGVLISLRAPTVRQAQQTMSVMMLLLFFVPAFGAQALPRETLRQLIEMLSSASARQVALVIALILVALDAALLAAAMARFQRARLILD